MFQFNVLLVDDNSGDLRLLQETFKEIPNSKYVVHSVSTLSDGLKILSELNFGVVLLDLNLPDCQGSNTYIAIHRKSPELPIIIITGIEEDIHAQEAVKLGAFKYLLKGWEKLNSKQLKTSIESAIHQTN